MAEGGTLSGSLRAAGLHGKSGVGGTHRWVWQLQDDLGASGLSWCWGRGGGQDSLMKEASPKSASPALDSPAM